MSSNLEIGKDAVLISLMDPLYTVKIKCDRFGIKTVDKLVDYIVNFYKRDFFEEVDWYSEEGHFQQLIESPPVLEVETIVTMKNKSILCFELLKKVSFPLAARSPRCLVRPFIYSIKDERIITHNDFLIVSDDLKQMVCAIFQEQLVHLGSNRVNKITESLWEKAGSSITLTKDEFQFIYFNKGSEKLSIPYSEMINFINPQYKSKLCVSNN